MTTEPFTDRETHIPRQSRAADDIHKLDAADLMAAADRETGDEPARSSVTRLLLVVAACVVLVTLFAVVAVQGLASAAKVALNGSECTVPGCVEVPLADIERKTGVDFPDGTTVEWSVTGTSLTAHRYLHFEVRIPAGAPVPDTPPYRGTPRPWRNATDPETGLLSGGEDFVERGLKDVRWAGGWKTGVDANGDSIVFGLDVDFD